MKNGDAVTDPAPVPARPQLAIDPDGGSLTVTFPSGNVAQLTTAEVEQTIKNLGLMRSGMAPEIPAGWTLGTAVQDVCRDPAWEMESDQRGDALLHVRDERLGWLHFIFTKIEAKRLGIALMGQAAAPLPRGCGGG